MILQFSECRPDYARYLSPYQVWAVLEPHESPAVALDHGFLPGSYDLSHFYLARSVRIDLGAYTVTGRIRYTARRCAGFAARIVPRRGWAYGAGWQRLAQTYLSRRLAGAGFSPQRLRALLDSPLTTDLLLVTDQATGEPAGLVTLYLEPPAAYYGVAVYDPEQLRLGLGGHLMATALGMLQQTGFTRAYLGSCYSQGALYKSRFPGMEFFNGTRWSADRGELRFLVERQEQLRGTHQLEFAPYRQRYGAPPLPPTGAAGWRLATESVPAGQR